MIGSDAHPYHWNLIILLNYHISYESTYFICNIYIYTYIWVYIMNKLINTFYDTSVPETCTNIRHIRMCTFHRSWWSLKEINSLQPNRKRPFLKITDILWTFEKLMSFRTTISLFISLWNGLLMIRHRIIIFIDIHSLPMQTPRTNSSTDRNALQYVAFKIEYFKTLPPPFSQVSMCC